MLIERATVGGLLLGYNFEGRNGETMHITHLLFADDTLVFCKDLDEQPTSLCWILLWFEAYSGLRINLDKSVILPMGTVDNVDQLALELGCKVGTLPTTYLGHPLGSRQASITVWDGVEERFRRKLSMWKRQYIAKGGRL